MTEYNEQATLFEWAKLASGRYPELRLLYHIPNGEKRHIAVAMKLKRMGVKAGVPDLHLPVARRKYNGLFMELKVNKNKLTDNQKFWKEALEKEGYFVYVAYGWEEAKNVLEWYLSE